jgi:hypothetical protein
LREIHPGKKRTPFSLPQYWGNNRNPVKLYTVFVFSGSQFEILCFSST